MSGFAHVEHVMGTAVGIDVRDECVGEPGLVEVIEWLHHVDRTFSTYRDDSEITRLGRGELTSDDLTTEVRDVLLRCEELRVTTAGAFDAFAVPAPNGTTLEPSGLVKGWAVEEAAALLHARGLRNFCINAGGDVVVRGCPLPDLVWRVGIRHPSDPTKLSQILVLDRPLGVATSGTYERGGHIIDSATRLPTEHLASVTVVGPDLAVADAYATAVFVMGAAGYGWLTDQPAYEGLIITHSGERFATAGWPSD